MPNTAKDAFIASPHRLEMERIVKTEAFQIACHYALLTLVEEQQPAETPAKGWDEHSQLYGARRLLRILHTLHEPVKEVKPPQPPTLNYNIGREKR